MKCDNCGDKLKMKKGTLILDWVNAFHLFLRYGFGKNIIINQAKWLECPNCKERLFSPQTWDLIDNAIKEMNRK